jgi:beta-phosphoglucomutase-like phosphatase (HAD superfamily)
VLKELGLVYEHEAFAKRFAGITDEEIFAQIFRENKMDFSVEEAVNKKEKILYGNVDEIKAMPGLLNLLQLLKENGIKIGFGFGIIKGVYQNCSEKLDIRRLFEVVVSADEVKMGKPAPDVFLRALNYWE